MTSNSTEVVLEVRDLTKIYGHEYSLLGKKFGHCVGATKDVTFTVHKGEIFGFLGPNGAGKTTTIRVILDYLHIDTGTITFFGNLDYHKDELKIKRNIGYMPGDLSLYDNFTGEELLAYVNHFRPMNDNLLMELRTIFHVDLTSKIKTLSKGNRQQLGLILALAPRPDLLILDEPTVGLDPLMTAHFHQILLKLNKEAGITVFLSSHDLTEVQMICDRVGIIKEGKIILIEQIENLKRKFVQNAKVEFNPTHIPTEAESKAIKAIYTMEQLSKYTFKFIIKENSNEFLKWLTNYDINHITIEDATLEEIFLAYYQ